jgi:hypothetical protein
LARVAASDPDLPGTSAADYHLAAGERLREVVSGRGTGWSVRGRGSTTSGPGSSRWTAGTTLTREKWLLVLFQELGYGRLQPAKALSIEDRDYPVSHGWGHTPIHLLSFKVEVDRRSEGVSGAARMSPHAMVQELLNRSDDHRWAFVTNGTVLRVLRDNASLSRQAYVEFDLAAMMDGEVYADFVLLWLLCHQSRVEGDRPEDCWLERWVEVADREGTRALDRLRDGVEAALSTLGTGLLEHPANVELRRRLQDGELSPQELLPAAASAGLPAAVPLRRRGPGPAAPARGAGQARRARAVRALLLDQAAASRWHDGKRAGSTTTCGSQLTLVFEQLASDEGCAELALPPLGSGLWHPELTGDVVGSGRCVTRLAQRRAAGRGPAARLDGGRSGGAGGRLPQPRCRGARERLRVAARAPPAGVGRRSAVRADRGGGNERKTTGSYYTPSSLINQLLDTALDPVLDRAMEADDPERALLGLTVCDPACGSGHFLVAAAHRMATRLATVRTGDSDASPEAVQEALRDVVSHCIYGVDVNPMAIELAKVSLWLEAHVPASRSPSSTTTSSQATASSARHPHCSRAASRTRRSSHSWEMRRRSAPRCGTSTAGVGLAAQARTTSRCSTSLPNSTPATTC